MDHKKWYTCALASGQVSVLALCCLIKIEGIRHTVVNYWIFYYSLEVQNVCLYK